MLPPGTNGFRNDREKTLISQKKVLTNNPAGKKFNW
jgi:hypothetical protein